MTASMPVAVERLMRCSMSSESLVVWKMEPPARQLVPDAAPFERLPLWARAMLPLLQLTAMGCALAMPPPPWVA
jgi:hypothetical protein